MNWTEYTDLFDPIINREVTGGMYDKEVYVEYVQLNKARINRWIKKNPISDESKKIIAGITEPQKWIVITEPWCGDAAHSLPIIKLLADLNDNIELEFVLRDSSDLIDSYLTNGGKSIPKLIVRDTNGKDLFTWGPRPEECQNLVAEMKNTDLSPQERNTKVQIWYNKNQGAAIQQEIVGLF